jgi:hypothetical protein
LTWQEASESWHDAVSQRFCAEHLEPLIPEVKLALEAINRLQLLLDSAQRDCER